MKKNKIKNFCHSPFLELDIGPDGNLKPCCKFESRFIPQFNINQGISKYKDSEFLKNLQEQFINDERPEGCIRCWREEDAGIKSKRQLDYDRHEEIFNEHDTSTTTFKNISLAFGNICNLACRICEPRNSSRWVSEMKKFDENKHQIYDWFRDPNIMLDIYHNTKSMVHCDIAGGEPLLLEIKEHLDFLKKIKQDGKNNLISLHYTTNSTNYPTEDLIELWRSFKKIEIQLSIDDIGARFEYNRWPAKWSQAYENIKKFQSLSETNHNIRLSISFTISAFTIFYADEFYSWCLAEGLPRPWMGRLHHPSYYRCSVLPDVIKNKAREKLMRSKHFEVRKLSQYLLENHERDQKDFLKITQMLDGHRNQSFVEVFPELATCVQSN